MSLGMGFPRSRVMVGHDGLWRVWRAARVRAKPAKAPADGRGAETQLETGHMLDSGTSAEWMIEVETVDSDSTGADVSPEWNVTRRDGSRGRASSSRDYIPNATTHVMYGTPPHSWANLLPCGAALGSLEQHECRSCTRWPGWRTTQQRHPCASQQRLQQPGRVRTQPVIGPRVRGKRLPKLVVQLPIARGHLGQQRSRAAPLRAHRRCAARTSLGLGPRAARRARAAGRRAAAALATAGRWCDNASSQVGGCDGDGGSGGGGVRRGRRRRRRRRCGEHPMLMKVGSTRV